MAMVGTRSSVSFRLEYFAGIVWPNEPIGPDGGGSADAFPSGEGCDPAFASRPPVPVVATDASPVDGCLEIGAIKAARASSGVGTLVKSPDCDDGCVAPPALICPVLGTRPGLVASSAWADTHMGG